MSHEEWLTVQDVVQLLKVHKDTVTRWLRTGRLKGRNFGGRTGYRIRRSDLDAFLLDEENDLGKAAA
jgi:excisionase family DNA binding protein